MKLILKRITSIIYRSESILELDLDPKSLSGIDYWSQEARSAKVKLLLDDALQSILQGSECEVKAGFHTLAAFIYDHQNRLLYTGVIPEAGFSIEYHSLIHKTVEIELLDHLGLILQLASDRLITITQAYLNPVTFIPAILAEILNPLSYEPDTEAYTNADVLRLKLCLGPINYQYAHYSYDQNKWLPFDLVDHVLVDSRVLWFHHPSYAFTNQVFGFVSERQDIFLIYWEFTSRTGHGAWDQHFRFRKYRLNLAEIVLIEEIDEQNNEHGVQLSHYPAPQVQQTLAGIGSYRINQGVAYYSGPASFQRVEVVPAEYKARELLGEFLRIANATLTLENYSFHINNRLDEDLPAIILADPLETEINQADDSKPSLTAVAIASQAIIDAVCKHYETTLIQYPFEARIKTHQDSPEIKALSLINPYDLLNHFISFDGYRIMPLDVSWDINTGEIEISGRAKR